MSRTGSYLGGSTVIHTGRPRAAYTKATIKREARKKAEKKRKEAELERYNRLKSKEPKIVSADDVPPRHKGKKARKRSQQQLERSGKKAQKKTLRKKNASQTAETLMEQSAKTSSNLNLLIHIGVEAGLKRAAAEQIAKKLRIKIYGSKA